MLCRAKANAICERVIGTIRRQCLDWLLPMSEGHLRAILEESVAHYDRGGRNSARGSGVLDAPPSAAVGVKSESCHRLAAGTLVLANAVLGGLQGVGMVCALSVVTLLVVYSLFFAL